MTLLNVKDLRVHFPVHDGVLRAVDGVSLKMEKGKTLGVVGESGCGKSTLGKAIARLYSPTSGSIELESVDIAKLSGKKLRALRPNIQMVFQDPNASLNPRKSIGQILGAPLSAQKRGTRGHQKEVVRWLLSRVGLPEDALHRFPHEFSGGQRQRIAIARALALRPKLIICDEAVSALDVSIRAQVLNLLTDLQDDYGWSYLFISHDLSVVELISDSVAVMYLGKIVEYSDGDSIWEQPLHPYTKALISAVPIPDPDARNLNRRMFLKGELPSPINPPTGCRFQTRCPFVKDRCRQEEPMLREVLPGHSAACHFAKELAS